MSGPSPVAIGGYISGGGGTIPVLGLNTVEITSNADLTLSLAQTDPYYIPVTSDGRSTSVRKVIVELIEGKTWTFKNATTEGFAIEVVGVSGNGVTISPGDIAIVTCDGANILGSTVVGSTAPFPVTVTYQPGGTASGTTFANFSSLLNYVTAFLAAGYTGLVVYQFDTSYGTISITGEIPGRTIEFIGIAGGAYAGSTAIISLLSGTSFVDFGSGGISSLNVTQCAVQNFANAPLATFNTFSNGGSLLLDFFSSWIQEAGSSTAFNVTNGALLFGYLFNNSSISVGSNAPAVTVDSSSGSGAVVFCSNESTVGTNAFAGSLHNAVNVLLTARSSIENQSTYGTAYTVTASNDSNVGTIFGGFVNFSSVANQTAYTPATPGNWPSPPALVSTALDDLALEVHTGTGANAITTLTGDGTASGPGSAVLAISKVNGVDYPAAPFTNGNCLQATGSNTLGLGALRLDGGASCVSGSLPIANLAGGTTGQTLIGNAGSPAWSNYVAFGGSASPQSTTGLVRFPNVGAFTARNPGNTGDLTIASSSSEGLQLGDSGFSQVEVLASELVFDAIQTLLASPNGTLFQLSGTASDFLAFGGPSSGSGAVAASGYLRSPALFAFKARNSANNADQNIASLDGASHGSFGDPAWISTGLFGQQVSLVGSTEIVLQSSTILLTGGTVAASGNLRAPATYQWTVRNEANTGDVNVVNLTTFSTQNHLALGDANFSSVSLNGGAQVTISASTTLFLAGSSIALAPTSSTAVALSGNLLIPSAFTMNALNAAGNGDLSVFNKSTFSGQDHLSFGDSGYSSVTLSGAGVELEALNTITLQTTESGSEPYQWITSLPKGPTTVPSQKAHLPSLRRVNQRRNR